VSPPAVVLVFVAGDAAAVGLLRSSGWGSACASFQEKAVPNVAEPYTRNLRRLNRIAICDGTLSLNQLNAVKVTLFKM